MNLTAMKIPVMKVSAPSNSGGSTKASTSAFKAPKVAAFKVSMPKMPKMPATNFSVMKFAKEKIPKEAKIKILKTAVKKVKNVGF